MILVTGATGLVGRPLVDLLLAEGATVRTVTRDPESANLPREVEVVQGDPSYPETLTGKLRDVDAVFLNPRTLGTAAEKFLALARGEGVRRVVAMSALNVDFELDRQPSRLRGEFNKETEAAAVASGLEWVSPRSGVYAVNTIGMWAAQLRAADVVRAPYAGAHWAPIHERDIAAVGAQALLTDDLLGTHPVLTGPHALTQAEMVSAIGEATGRPLRFEEIPAEVAIQGMMRSGMPEVLARGFMSMQADSYGQAGLVSGEVERTLGRPGRTFAEWAADHAEDFARGRSS